MNTVIVPVDFSETSLNAALYACDFLTGQYGVTIILYHSYSGEHGEAVMTASLDQLRQELMAQHPVNIEVLAHRDDDFIEGLGRAARHRSADLVIMGITGKSAFAQVLFGSNTLKMAHTKICPVLIVPSKARFTKMKNVMLTSDFKDTLNSTPSEPIKKFLKIYNPQLHVVNVDKDHYISLTEQYEKEKQDLKKLLEEFNPEFYFMRIFDVEEALELFSNDREIDLVIAVQKNHSFMEKVFNISTSKKLSFQSKMPILVIHE